MQGKRILRVGELLHHELSHLFSRDMKDPRIGFVTVSRVDVTEDFKHAKVYISMYGSEEEKREAMRALEGATGFIRGLLGKRLRLKKVPQLTFLVDESAEYSIRISKMLKELGVSG